MFKMSSTLSLSRCCALKLSAKSRIKCEQSQNKAQKTAKERETSCKIIITKIDVPETLFPSTGAFGCDDEADANRRISIFYAMEFLKVSLLSDRFRCCFTSPFNLSFIERTCCWVSKKTLRNTKSCSAVNGARGPHRFTFVETIRRLRRAVRAST